MASRRIHNSRSSTICLEPGLRYYPEIRRLSSSQIARRVIYRQLWGCPATKIKRARHGPVLEMLPRLNGTRTILQAASEQKDSRTCVNCGKQGDFQDAPFFRPCAGCAALFGDGVAAGSAGRSSSSTNCLKFEHDRSRLPCRLGRDRTATGKRHAHLPVPGMELGSQRRSRNSPDGRRLQVLPGNNQAHQRTPAWATSRLA
jgi:hypothetical protein